MEYTHVCRLLYTISLHNKEMVLKSGRFEAEMQSGAHLPMNLVYYRRKRCMINGNKAMINGNKAMIVYIYPFRQFLKIRRHSQTARFLTFYHVILTLRG